MFVESFAAVRKPVVSLATVIKSSLFEFVVSVTLSWAESYAAVTPAAELLIRLITVVSVSVSLFTDIETPLIVNAPVLTLLN